MRWSRFALGVLPAAPVIIVSVVVLAMGGPETEPDEQDGDETTARIDLPQPPPRGAATRTARTIARPRTTTRVPRPPPADPAGEAAEPSKFQSCCEEMRRYRRATPRRYRALYDEILGLCPGAGEAAIPEDDEPMLEKVRSALDEKDAPYVPPSCR